MELGARFYGSPRMSGCLELDVRPATRTRQTEFVVLVFVACSSKGCSAYSQLYSGPVNWAVITWLTTIMSDGLTHRPK